VVPESMYQLLSRPNEDDAVAAVRCSGTNFGTIM
jgi:hypothetical protein